jgi:O-antigen/teichoic acid export membrane protein
MRRSGRANVGSQTVALAAGYAGSFIIAPILIARVGLTQFGFWAVTGAFAQYAAVLDFGITRALARFVALYHGQRDDVVAEVMGLGLLCSLILTAIMVVGALITASLFASTFHTGLHVSAIRIVLVSSALLFGASILQRVIAAYPTGKQDFVTPSLGQIGAVVVNLVLSIVVLSLSRRLAAYAEVSAVAAGLGVLCIFGLVRVRAGRIPFALPSRRLAREVLAYGAKGQVPWILDLANFQTDKVVIAALVDLKAAAGYELVNRISGAARQIAVLGSTTMLPRGVALIRQSGRQVVGSIAAPYSILLADLIGPLFVLVSVCGISTMGLWLGTVPPDGLVILLGLNAAYVLNCLSGAISSLAAADATQAILVIPAIVATATNLVLTVTLGPLFGLVGVLTGTTVALGLGSFVGIRMFARRYGVGVATLMSAMAKEVAISACVALPVIPIAIATGSPHARTTAVVDLALVGVPMLVLMTAVMRQRFLRALRVARSAGAAVTRTPASARHRSAEAATPLESDEQIADPT